jgi:hypothetical protein
MILKEPSALRAKHNKGIYIMPTIKGWLLVSIVITSLLHAVDQPNADMHNKTHGIPFTKVIIWGVKLHSHTHSYIHWAFFRAFEQLGFPVLWLDNSDDLTDLDLSQSLFVTVGLADQKIPLRQDCWYILHNVEPQKYAFLFKQGHGVIMQVYTHDCLKRNVTYFDDYIGYDLSANTLYMPWATDLLPDEIDAIKRLLPSIKKDFVVSFVGSKWGGSQGNWHELEKFERACKDYGIPFNIVTKVGLDEHIALVQKAFMAPALQGQWQCEHGYIPCRIFKNISYGQPGITNSETVYNLFHKTIIYNPDCYKLFYDAMERIPTITLAQQYELMDFVRDKHTYLNRIDDLLKVLKMIHDRVQARKLIWQALQPEFTWSWYLFMPITSPSKTIIV